MEEDDFISKTRRKRQMDELQRVGAALVKLSGEQLARIDLPEVLREAVHDARRFTKHEALRRQVQYIGRIMRDLDCDPIIEQLAALQAPSRRQTALFHVAERWRGELLADPGALERFAREFPAADRDRLGELLAGVQEEKRTGRPPRKFRELFHMLNAIVQDRARQP